MNHSKFPDFALCFWLTTGLFGCEPPAPGPQGDSHTNWLRTCNTDDECGGLSCLCGVCTAPCSTEDACSVAPGSSCLPATHGGSVALCAGQAAPHGGMCLPTCSKSDDCATGQACVAGACQPAAAPNASISVDTTQSLQRLTGFGATVGYAEDEIAAYSDQAALAQAMFAGLGLDVLRFRNRYTDANEPPLQAAADIVTAAASSLGRAPLVLLGSWSPPAELKQNGNTFCSDPATCTLTTTAGGGFDYAGLAAHWQSSLAAYARVGVVPDYIGIQNNPDWSPSGGASLEACKFLPREGTENVFVGGVSKPIRYPGYDRALSAVVAAMAELPTRPRVLAPELSRIVGAKDYMSRLDSATVDAVAHHMYGADPNALDLASLEELAQLGTDMQMPLFQTEMQADGFGTALLIHHSLAEGGASMYLQTALVGPLSGPAINPTALIGLEGERMVLQDPYFAMSHFSRFTDPGWSRVAAQASTPGLLASAWLSPSHDALTIVLINAGADSLSVALDLGAERVRSAKLRRTIFDGAERFADLGEWAAESTVSLPPRSLATISIEE